MLIFLILSAKLVFYLTAIYYNSYKDNMGPGVRFLGAVVKSLGTVSYIEINAFALSILLVIFMSMHYRASKNLDNKLFLGLLGFNALSIVVNTIELIIDGNTGGVARGVKLFVDSLGFILASIALILWNLYARYQVYRDEENTKRILIPLIIPACINAVLAILSWFKGYYFFLDENNYYHRGKLFIFYAALCFFYILYPEIFIILKQKQISKKYFIPLVMFAIPPLIAGTLQTLFYGVSLIWIGMTVSVLIIFLNIQNDQLYTDHLTGLSNRRHLDRYLQENARRGNKENLLAGILIDLDFFKQINDTWGHLAGDRALVSAGEILRRSFRRNDLICRYGGDEFIVIFEVEKELDLIGAVNRLKMNLKKYEEQNPTPYVINFSMGYDIYNFDSETNLQQFIQHLDTLMYEHKKYRNTKIG
jgi:diguanylate cyclase (GGDEF)-like protein